MGVFDSYNLCKISFTYILTIMCHTTGPLIPFWPLIVSRAYQPTDEEAETPYTWAIILGGTNDLVMGTRGNDIWEALKVVYKTSLQAGTRVLVVIVPEWGDWSSTIDAQRDRLNSLIQSHRAINMYAHRETILKQSTFIFKSLPEQ
jgi:hypothetical protein